MMNASLIRRATQFDDMLLGWRPLDE